MRNLTQRITALTFTFTAMMIAGCAANTTSDQAANSTPRATKPFFPVASFTPLPSATPTAVPTATPNPIPVALSARINIPAGSFTMGISREEGQIAIQECTDRDRGDCPFDIVTDAIPPHRVAISAFEIDVYEVTYTQYVAYLNYRGAGSHSNGCFSRPCIRTTADTNEALIRFDGTTYSTAATNYDNTPVAFVTWYGALAYCQTFGLRLPTEAEWEYAASRPDERIYPWGNEWDETKTLSSKPTIRANQAAIDEFAGDVTADGVYGMAGNVSEWINDVYDAQYYQTLAGGESIDPQGSTGNGTRVVRGGNFRYGPIFSRNTQRQERSASQAAPILGFRCARSVG